MKDGFVKLVLASPETVVGDACANAEKICKIISEADALGAGLLVLPELSLTGATCGDLFKHDALIAGAEGALSKICNATLNVGFPVVVGLPLSFRGKVYDAGAVVAGGRVMGIVPCRTAKGAFSAWTFGTERTVICDEEVPVGNLLFSAIGAPDFVFGLEIGCDGVGALPTSAYLASAGANLVCSLSATGATVGSTAKNRERIRMRSDEFGLSIAYVGAGPAESVTDELYSGDRVVCSLGETVACGEPLTCGLTVCEVDLGAVAYRKRDKDTFDGAFTWVEVPVVARETTLTTAVKSDPFIPTCKKKAIDTAREVLTIQGKALARRMEHIKAKSLVIGISGGLDSTIAILACARAVDELGLPRTAIKAISMPGFGTSKKTRGNAEIISERLGADFREISIEGAVRRHFEDIGHDESVHDVTYENSQARERTQILMDLANKTGGIVVGTGDLSEVALGFATYNGDHMSMYAVNASVPKTLIRAVITQASADCEDEELAKALLDVVKTPVSPELLPTKDGEIAQITEDIVGPYELHDFFLYQVIVNGANAKKVVRLAVKAFEGTYDEPTIKKWLRRFITRFFAQQFKRNCVPDGVKVTEVSLSPRGAWAMPSEASASLWLKDLD